MLLGGIYYGKTPIARAYKGKDIIWSLGVDKPFMSESEIAFDCVAMVTPGALAAIKQEYRVLFESDAIAEALNSASMCPIIFWTSNLPTSVAESLDSSAAAVIRGIDTGFQSTNSALPSSAAYVGLCVLSESDVVFCNAPDSRPIWPLLALYTSTPIDLHAPDSNAADVDEHLSAENHSVGHSSDSAPASTIKGIDSNYELDGIAAPSVANQALTELGMQSPMYAQSRPSISSGIDERVIMKSDADGRAQDSSPAKTDSVLFFEDKVFAVAGDSVAGNAAKELMFNNKANATSSDGIAQFVDENGRFSSDHIMFAGDSRPQSASENAGLESFVNGVASDTIEHDVDVCLKFTSDSGACSGESAPSFVGDKVDIFTNATPHASDSIDASVNNHTQVNGDVSGRSAESADSFVNNMTEIYTSATSHSSDIIDANVDNCVLVNNNAVGQSSGSIDAFVDNDVDIVTDAMCRSADAVDTDVDNFTLVKGDMIGRSSESIDTFVNEVTTHNTNIVARSMNSDAKTIQHISLLDQSSDIRCPDTYQALVDAVDIIDGGSDLYTTSGLPAQLSSIDKFDSASNAINGIPCGHFVGARQIFDGDLSPTMGVPNVTHVDEFICSKAQNHMTKGSPIDGLFNADINSRGDAYIDSNVPSFYNARATLLSEVKAFLDKLSMQDFNTVKDIVSSGEATITITKTYDGFITDLCFNNNDNVVVVSSNILSTIIDIAMQDQVVASAANKKLVNIEDVVAHAYDMSIHLGCYHDGNIVATEWDRMCSIANITRAVCKTITIDTSPVNCSLSFGHQAILSVMTGGNWEWPVRRWGTDLLITQVLEIDDGDEINLLLL